MILHIGEGDAERRMVWAVAAGAGVATAHGLYQVALSARVPASVAWLYPLITDGLALVAYAATGRLPRGRRGYAATVVVLAAGLSGLAQAVYLAGGIDHTGPAPAGLRFGVGVWPAFAAALTAHLLHLISAPPATEAQADAWAASSASSQSGPLDAVPSNAVGSPQVQRPVASDQPIAHRLDGSAAAEDRDAPRTVRASARDRAQAAARRHYDEHVTGAEQVCRRPVRSDLLPSPAPISEMRSTVSSGTLDAGRSDLAWLFGASNEAPCIVIRSSSPLARLDGSAAGWTARVVRRWATDRDPVDSGRALRRRCRRRGLPPWSVQTVYEAAGCADGVLRLSDRRPGGAHG